MMVAEAAGQQAVVAQQPNPKKFSRYRSVKRTTNAPRAAEEPPLPTQSLPSDEAVFRSRARYHKPVHNPQVEPLPVRTTWSEIEEINRRRSDSLAALTGEHVSQPAATRPGHNQRSHGSHERCPKLPNTRDAAGLPISYEAAKLEARDILQAEDERLKRLKAQERSAADAARQNRRLTIRSQQRQPPQDRTGAHVAVAPTTEQETRTRSTTHDPSRGGPHNETQHSNDVPESILRQRWRSPKPNKSPASSEPKELNSRGQHHAEEPQRLGRNGPPNLRSSAVETTRAPALLPQSFDAPISAVNAGKRRVMVRCDSSSITLPVTPTTTAQDLVNSASVVMSEPIDPRKSILVETFAQLGLQRPLRRYEHVRDVLNSWDHDDQNCLTVTSADITVLNSLDSSSVTKNEPQDASIIMYHSQKPGKWNKRCLTLRSDGQVTVAKRGGDAENSNICHISDFDIYTTTQQQLKKIRPPKKHCWAIKSLQKSALFLEGQNFVHFFATSDQALGDQWYRAVQSWRSRYLIHVMGEGHKMQAKPANALEAMRSPGTASSHETVPYQLGSFQPLLDLDLNQTKPDDARRRKMSSRDRRTPPTAFPGLPAGDSDHIRGRATSISRTSSPRSTTEPPSRMRRSGSSVRSRSTSRQPEPLLDSAPRWQGPHLRNGHGVTAASGQPLINLITEPERNSGAVTVPSAREWKQLDAHSSPKLELDIRQEQGFTGTGFLARSGTKRAQGGDRSGHGVKGADGHPLVDLDMSSKFVDGSLLRQVEAWKGNEERGLVVDRQKRVEKSMKVGEGFA